ncbi:MAG: hypothetical protein FJ090_04860 [Deltaproteobacteria bacterium]|nr:hypothetical protein [Deltaproteobacteria bacterium]
MRVPANPSQLDPRFSAECPDCGKTAAWTGGLEQEDGRTYLDMACPHCGNGYLCYRAEWQALFAAFPPPRHSPFAS